MEALSCRFVLDGMSDEGSGAKLCNIPISANTVYCPVNISRRHWILLVLNMQAKEIMVYDPQGNEHPDTVGKYIQWLGASAWSAVYPKHKRRIPRQSNGYDCGVFVCMYASYLMQKHDFDFNQHDMENFRKWIAHRIARG
jgi:sentrin-specific protease 1